MRSPKRNYRSRCNSSSVVRVVRGDTSSAADVGRFYIYVYTIANKCCRLFAIMAFRSFRIGRSRWTGRKKRSHSVAIVTALCSRGLGKVVFLRFFPDGSRDKAFYASERDATFRNKTWEMTRRVICRWDIRACASRARCPQFLSLPFIYELFDQYKVDFSRSESHALRYCVMPI